jgi:hypothetical protein
MNDVNYKVNVGGCRGVVVYYINMLREYKRSIPLTVDRREDIEELNDFFPYRSNETTEDLKFGENLC